MRLQFLEAPGGDGGVLYVGDVALTVRMIDEKLYDVLIESDEADDNAPSEITVHVSGPNGDVGSVTV